MIHDEICTYEVAKLAKEKGFDVPTFGYYRIDTEDWYRTDVYDDWNDSTILLPRRAYCKDGCERKKAL